MMYVCFFFNDPATTEIYPYGHTLSLHDALPICRPDLLFHAAIKHVDTMCEVGKDKADVQLTLEIHAERGPANTKGIAEFNRSEEHTSELQSLMRISYAVFCLKTKQKDNINAVNQQQ